MPLPTNRSGYQAWQNWRGTTGGASNFQGGGAQPSGAQPTGGAPASAGQYNPDWNMANKPGYYADPATRASWDTVNQRMRSYSTGWQGGKYGYTNLRGGQRGQWQAYQMQPGRVPQDTGPTDADNQRNQMWDEYQTAMDEAKANTEARYQEALGNLEGVGVQQGRDIDTRFDSSRGAVNQSLVDSGLSGTTVLGSMRRGVERERTDAQARLATNLARERNQIIQSRNDIPPDLQMLTQLMFQQGSGGGQGYPSRRKN